MSFTKKKRLAASEEKKKLVEKTKEELHVSEGTANGILVDLAVGDTEKWRPRTLPIDEIADKWGVPKEALKRLRKDRDVDLSVIREALTEKAMVLTNLAQNDLLETLTDPSSEAMMSASLRDRASALKALTDSLVTLQDGHKPQKDDEGQGKVNRLIELLEKGQAEVDQIKKLNGKTVK